MPKMDILSVERKSYMINTVVVLGCSIQIAQKGGKVITIYELFF